ASAPLVVGGTRIGQDAATFFYPMYGFLGEQLRAGNIPGWNPYQFAGAPFAGDPESGWTYLPAMVFFTLLPLEAAAKTFIVFHLALAAFAGYALARLLGISPGGAVVAATVVTLNGLTYGRASCCPAYLQVATLVPPLLLGAELVVRARSRPARLRAWGITGLLVSQVLAAWLGQGAGYALLALGGYLAYRTLLDPPGNPQPLTIRLGRLALDGLMILGLGVALAAAGILPRFAFHAQSNLADGYVGDLAWAADLGGWTATEAAGRLFSRGLNYIGGTVLVLALVGVFLAGRRFAMPFWVALSAGVLLLATEQSSPVHDVLQVLAPTLADLHAHWPERVTVVLAIGPAMLAGAGVTMLAQSRERLALRHLPSRAMTLSMLCLGLALATALPLPDPLIFGFAAGAGLVGAIALALADAGSRRLVTAAVAITVVVDLLMHGRYDQGYGGVHKVDIDAYFDPTGAAAFLQERQDTQPPFRFFGYDPTITYLENPEPPQLALYRYQYGDPRTTSLVVNNRATLFGLSDVQGYNPLQLQRYVEYVAAMNGGPQEYHGLYVLPGGANSPLLDMLNARYVVVPANPSPAWPGLGPASDAWPTVYADQRVRVLERLSALPRAWIVHDAQQVAPDEALAQLVGGASDPRRVVLLEDPPPPTGEPADPAADAAEITQYSPDTITIRTTSGAPGLLVLAETWDPGWRATVNGAEVTIYRANYALRAIPIPAGVSTIELHYTPPSLQLGLVVSSIGLVALTAALLGGPWHPLRQRRRGRGAAQR
ncbi:MAG TPA: YfhO family protein, partial [Thermomicrobiales bacterium]|nr:YfhO family protein [Thermomicrobiales bacterium]